MSPSDFITSHLPQIRECLSKHPVEKVWLFGSYSRGEEREDSDIDFLVEYVQGEQLSLLDVSRLYRALRNLLGREIDVVEDGYLLPYAALSANRDKILIYERSPKR
ncbi:MAG: nucleotidyltransferase domain-containing protein [Bacteroidales bacterium]|nr:nucleotidyltransferase domain-containing protein [Bacteroidales bacterium]